MASHCTVVVGEILPYPDSWLISRAKLCPEEPRPGDSAAKLLTKDEACRIAVNIAKLPELLRKT